MNREILFRGKRIDNGERVEGDYVCTNSGRCFIKIHELITVRACNDIFEVIPETVGQYTGLHDSTKWESLSKSEQQEWLKNHTADEWKGKKIFEGDIIKHNVMYSEGKAIKREDQFFTIRYSIKQARFLAYLQNGVFNPTAMQNCEVIGNIHDNPELI